MPQSFSDLVERSRHIRPLRVLTGHTEYVTSATFSPDGRLLATGSGDNTLRLWDVESGRELRVWRDHGAYVYASAFSPDGKRLVSCCGDGKLRAWDVHDSRLLLTMEGQHDSVWNVAYAPDGRHIASACGNGAIHLWDAATGQQIRQQVRHESYGFAVAFSPDGRWLASAGGSNDQVIRVTEAETARERVTMQEHTQGMSGLAFSPDGRLLASSSYDGSARLWEVETGRSLWSVRASNGMMNAVAWSPDGEVVAAAAVQREGQVRLLHPATGQVIHTLETFGAGHETSRALAFSPDGRHLASYPKGSQNQLQLWDISSLGLGRAPQSRPVRADVTRALQGPVQVHLRTLAFGHVTAADLPPSRVAAWLRGASATGQALPLGLARDLGVLLSVPAGGHRIEKPAHLPFDLDTSGYGSFLNRLAAHPLVRELPTWQPALSDAALAVVLARLVDGLELPTAYAPPGGPAGVLFMKVLGAALERADPAQVWRDTSAEQRPNWMELLPAAALARIEANLAALDRHELRFLARYGPALAGAPDPREVVDLLALTGLPSAARLALWQSLQLLPRLNTNRAPGGVQTYPEGGYEGLARTGSVDSLLPTEAAYPRPLFLHRVLNGEALYYGRERPREKRKELAYVVAQAGLGLGGDGEVLARAALLALGRSLAGQGHEVWYSFAGPELSEPRPLSRPGELARVLYHREDGAAVPRRVLGSVLRRLKGWRDSYRGRQVFWVVGEHFDADSADEHAPLYHGLRAETPQHAWFVRVGAAPNGSRRPAASHYFATWQVVETFLLWQNEERLAAIEAPPAAGRG